MKEFYAKGGSTKILKEIERKRPKKALSAYMIFVRETRQIICGRNPEMHALQIMKEVGKWWQTLSPEKKERFLDQARKDKIRYNKQMEQFQNEISAMNDPQNNESLKISGNFDKNPSIFSESANKNPNEWEKKFITVKNNTKKARKRKNSNKPKRPLSAYIYFSQEVRRFCLKNVIDARGH